MTQNDLLHEDAKKLFFKYLLPSISATLVTSIYVLADTIMIGKGIGTSGIATLNYILPIFTLLFGTGLLLGVGGAFRNLFYHTTRQAKKIEKEDKDE